VILRGAVSRPPQPSVQRCPQTRAIFFLHVFASKYPKHLLFLPCENSFGLFRMTFCVRSRNHKLRYESSGNKAKERDRARQSRSGMFSACNRVAGRAPTEQTHYYRAILFLTRFFAFRGNKLKLHAPRVSREVHLHAE